MKITYISTLNHNIGDDFVRQGITNLLLRVFRQISVECVNKHLPLSARPEWDWYHNSVFCKGLEKLRSGLSVHTARAIDATTLRPSTDRVMNCDVLIQSGAPIYWTGERGIGCNQNEWWHPLIERRWLVRPKRGRFLSIAGGTCQQYNSDGAEFSSRPDILDYVRRFYDLTNVSTVRDRLSEIVLSYAGRTAYRLPCTSLWASGRGCDVFSSGEYVAFNYMPGAGHFALGQNIDEGRWASTFRNLLLRVSQREKCVIVCHNAKERETAMRLFNCVPIFYAKDFREYLLVYGRAKYGIMNRVHGAFAMAGMGRPSIVVGADSRARMAEEIGLSCHFVQEVDEDALASEAEVLSQKLSGYWDEIAERKRLAEVSYCALLEQGISR